MKHTLGDEADMQPKSLCKAMATIMEQGTKHYLKTILTIIECIYIYMLSRQ
jgi:hypothetical protein